MYLYGPSDYWLGLLGKAEADKNGQETIMPNTKQTHRLNSNRRKIGSYLVLERESTFLGPRLVFGSFMGSTGADNGGLLTSNTSEVTNAGPSFNSPTP